MTYYADLVHDLPTPYTVKRVIFYRRGLKVYGLLPYILQRKLKAQFFSGSIRWGNVRISAGSFESNWTAVPYNQSPEHVIALLNWLYSDRGFEVALAAQEDWDDNIFSGNVYRMPPSTWFPVGDEQRSGFVQVAGGSSLNRHEIVALLAFPKQEE